MTMILVLVCSVPCTLLTPLGFGMVGYVLGFLRHPITQTLNREFMPPTVRMLTGQLFYGFVVVWVAALTASGRRLTAGETIRTLLFGGLAAMASRNVAWLGFVAGPTLAANLSVWASGRRVGGGRGAGRPWLSWVLLGLVGLLVVLGLPWLRPYMPWPAARRAHIFTETPA